MTLAVLIGTRTVTITVEDGMEEVTGTDNSPIEMEVHLVPQMMEMMRVREILINPSITLGEGISRTNDNWGNLTKGTQYQWRYIHGITHQV